MKYDAKEFKKYPEIMNKEQMRIACHISKQTALYLLQFNLIPHTCTGKKTRCYAIKKSDVIAFMNDREVNPEKYIAPKNWYKYGSEMVRPYKIRIHPPCAKDEKKLRRYYESKLAALPDVMDVAAAVDFTGYNRRTVCQWIRVGKLKALALLQKYMIPNAISSTGSARTITTTPTANPADISICFGRRRNGEMGDEETHSWRSDLQQR